MDSASQRVQFSQGGPPDIDRNVRLEISIMTYKIEWTYQDISLLSIAGSTTKARIIKFIEKTLKFPSSYHVLEESLLVEDQHGQVFRDEHLLEALFDSWGRGDILRLLVTAQRDGQVDLTAAEALKDRGEASQSSPANTVPQQEQQASTESEGANQNDNAPPNNPPPTASELREIALGSRLADDPEQRDQEAPIESTDPFRRQ
ncbi:MAG: hypothetical protein Q9164_006376 [Protoblastenia rupestris]